MQLARDPTHRAGHTLDLVITKKNRPASNVDVCDYISDHALVKFNLEVAKPRRDTVWTSVRLWKRLSLSAFVADLLHSSMVSNQDHRVDLAADELAALYDKEMLLLLDKHCPVVKVRRKLGLTSPWFDGDCRQSRRRSRML